MIATIMPTPMVLVTVPPHVTGAEPLVELEPARSVATLGR